MIYAYKAVPFIGSSAEQIEPFDVAKQLSALINSESLSGWQFYQINSVNISVVAGCLSALISAWLPFGGGKSYEKRYDMLIFRQECNENDKNVVNKFAVDIKPIKKGPPAGADSKCPQCSSPIRHDDQACWKCSADFSHPQGWKTIRH